MWIFSSFSLNFQVFLLSDFSHIKRKFLSIDLTTRKVIYHALHTAWLSSAYSYGNYKRYKSFMVVGKDCKRFLRCGWEWVNNDWGERNFSWYFFVLQQHLWKIDAVKWKLTPETQHITFGLWVSLFLFL